MTVDSVFVVYDLYCTEGGDIQLSQPMKENCLCTKFLLIQWVSEFNIHENHLKGFLKYRSLGHTPRGYFRRSGVVPENQHF